VVVWLEYPETVREFNDLIGSRETEASKFEAPSVRLTRVSYWTTQHFQQNAKLNIFHSFTPARIF